jgi:hypothetical protein
MNQSGTGPTLWWAAQEEEEEEQEGDVEMADGEEE